MYDPKKDISQMSGLELWFRRNIMCRLLNIHTPSMRVSGLDGKQYYDICPVCTKITKAKYLGHVFWRS